jgi:hypothetical protein
LAKLNPKKAFLRSPLVFAASHGRQDLIQMMVKTLGFDVDAPEEHTGLNALAMAVNNKNMVAFSYTYIFFIMLTRGLKHAARQMHLCGPRTSQKMI